MTKPLLLKTGPALFIFTVFSRLLYVTLVRPDASLAHKMPEAFDRYAMTIMNGAKDAFMTCYGSYPLFLGGFYKLLHFAGILDYRLLCVAAFSTIAAGFSVIIFYKIAQHVHPNQEKWNIFLSLLFACYYPSIYLNTLNVSENFFTPLLMIIFYLCLKSDRAGKFHGLALGVTSGFALALRPAIAPFLLLILFWLVRTYRARALRQIVTYLIAMILIVSATAIANQSFDKHGEVGIAGNGGVNFFLAWCEPTLVRYELADGESRQFVPPARAEADAEMSYISDVPFHKQAHYYKKGLACLQEKPMRILTGARRVYNIFDSTFYPYLVENYAHQILLLLWRNLSLPLFILFLIYPLLFKQDRQAWSLGALMLGSLLLAVYLNGVGEERYIVPYFFALILWGIPSAKRLFFR